jgi:hypothetical protein
MQLGSLQMSKQPKQRPPKITDWDTGPHIFANEIINVTSDGNTICISLGRNELMVTTLGEMNSPEVVSFRGSVTLSPNAAAKLIQALSNTIDQLKSMSGGSAGSGNNNPPRAIN